MLTVLYVEAPTLDFDNNQLTKLLLRKSTVKVLVMEINIQQFTSVFTLVTNAKRNV